ncbi:MAG: citrate synthase, partial [Opitutaceae bacterium]|nr:citrate synthase [Opitutaceae bacterium]
MKKDPLYVTSAEVIRRLRITRETLYAYVSRGLIRSEKMPGSHRKKWYYREDVESLLKKKEIRQNPGKAVRGALRWGEPILDSQITRIYDGSFFYRNVSAFDLAQEAEFEDVFTLLVMGQSAPQGLSIPVVKQLIGRLTGLDSSLKKVQPLDALLASIPLMAYEDSLRMDLRPESVMLKGYAMAVTLTKWMLSISGKIEGESIAEVLVGGCSAANRNKFERLLTQALILGADHELSTSAFAARVTASGQANPYEAVASGLYALRGRRHGGSTLELERFWNEIKKPTQVDRVIDDWLEQGK